MHLKGFYSVSRNTEICREMRQSNFGFEYKDGEENIDMCKALEDWAEESRSEGIEEGKIDTTVGLLSLGKLSLEEISRVTKFSIERIKEIAASRNLPYPAV